MMKKLLSFTAILAISAGMNAQQMSLGTPKMAAQGLKATPASASVTIDTIRPASVVGTGCGVSGSMAGLYYYTINLGAGKDSGYYFGTGKFPQAGYLVTGLAMKFKMGANGGTVSNVLVLAAKGKGTATTTTASIYSASSKLAPATSLGTSTPLPMSAYSGTSYTSYTFATPVAVGANTSFFAGISVPAFGGTDKDTLALLDTQAGCNSNDSLSYVQFNSSTWIPVTRVFGSSANLDLMIFPVVDITTGINNFVSKGGLTLYAASPNPANNMVNFNFSLADNSKVEVEIFDITGKSVKHFQGSDLYAAGKNTIGMDVSSLQSGSYMYSINAGGTMMFSKFVVVK
jgi:hypothetical protein